MFALLSTRPDACIWKACATLTARPRGVKSAAVKRIL